MRDEHDTQTADLIPAKRGRPCKDPDLGPMTPAERAHAYRQRRKRAAHRAALVAISVANLPDRPKTREELDALSTPAMIDALRAFIAEEDRENATLVLRLIAGRVQQIS